MKMLKGWLQVFFGYTSMEEDVRSGNTMLTGSSEGVSGRVECVGRSNWELGGSTSGGSARWQLPTPSLQGIGTVLLPQLYPLNGKGQCDDYHGWEGVLPELGAYGRACHVAMALAPAGQGGVS
ncbi:hypothetical protein F0562_036230 [Nyssa sinensis]|uniref:Uncharacterized protein n=1 Tax=Nyssa sinensis TaxID=561372 RepID=A0A5J5ACY9_9ASTE|nr:hypothetical protein F0562_036230 [Nyssa sinensis]